MDALERVTTDLFHAMYYYSPHTWNGGVTRWKGIPVLGNPLDMWMLQQTIIETKPDLIVETGSACGGSALFYTDVSPRVGVVSIDIQTEMQPMIEHPRVTFIKAMSTDKKTIASVKQQAKGKRVMVILDSDHTTANVLAELKAYSPIVTRGCYLIVQDTNIDSHPVNHPQYIDNGPMKAVKAFMQGNKDFEVDHYKGEAFYMTFYPGGWLRCIR